MKIIVSWLAICFFTNTTSAQISVTASDFVSGEDTTLVSVVTDFQNIDFSTTGPNTTWDYSNVLIDSQRIDSFFNMSSVGFIYQLIFNNFLNPDYESSYYTKADASLLGGGGGLPITTSDPIAFVKVSNNKVENVGAGINLNGAPFPVTADTIDNMYILPMTFQDNWTSNSYFYVDINPLFNAQYKRYQNRESEVDGYGTVITPYGSFEAIRVKSVLNYNDSINIDIFGNGGQWTALPANPIVEYTWWAKDQKIPVFEITTSLILGNETITSVEFRDDPIDYTNITDNHVNIITLYPNPTKQSFAIESSSPISSVKCYSSNGQLIYESNSFTTNDLINTENWNSGFYYVKILVGNKTISKKINIQ